MDIILLELQIDLNAPTFENTGNLPLEHDVQYVKLYHKHLYLTIVTQYIFFEGGFVEIVTRL